MQREGKVTRMNRSDHEGTSRPMGRLGSRLAVVVGVLLLAGEASAQGKIGETTVAWFVSQPSSSPETGPFMRGVFEALTFLGLRCPEPVTVSTLMEVWLGLRQVARESPPEELRQASLMGAVTLILATRGCSLDAGRAMKLNQAMDAARRTPR